MTARIKMLFTVPFITTGRIKMIPQIEQTSQRYISIPMEIIGQVDKPIEAMIWGYIRGWENSTNRSRVYLHSGISRMSLELNVSIDTITRAIRVLVHKGLIVQKRTPNGQWYSTRIDLLEPESFETTVSKCESKKHVKPQIAECRGTPQIAECKSNTTQVTQYIPSELLCNSETTYPTEPTTTPILHRPRLKPREAEKYVQLTNDQAVLASKYLGSTGEDNKVPALFTLEQSSKSGFIDFVLKKCIESLVKKKVRSRIGMLCMIRDDQWNDGRWVDPDIADLKDRQVKHSEEDQAKLKRRELFRGESK